MDKRHGGRSSAVTLDHLLVRLDELEWAFAAVQRARVDLQATARAQPRAPLVDEVLADSPVPEDAGVGRARAAPVAPAALRGHGRR